MKQYSRYAFWLFTGEMVHRACAFFANIHIARSLENETYGLIAIGTSFLRYASLIGDAGVTSMGLLEYSKSEARREHTFSELMSAKIVQSLVAFVLLFFLSLALYKNTPSHKINTLYIGIIFFQAIYIDWLFKGLRRFKQVTVARTAAGLIYVSAVYLLVKEPTHVSRVPLLFFGANLFSALLLLVQLPATGTPITFQFTFRKYKKLLVSSLRIGIGTMLIQVINYLPPPLIGLLCSFSDAGIYGAATRIMTAAMIVDTIFATIFFSSLSKKWEHDKDRTRAGLNILLRLIIALGGLIALCIAALAHDVTLLLYGPAYAQAGTILAILSPFILFTMLNSLFAYGLIAIGNKRLFLRASLIGSFFSILFIFTGIYFFGNNGGAMAVVLSELIFISLMHRQFKRFCDLPLFTPLVIGLTVGGGTYALTHGLLSLRSFHSLSLMTPLYIILIFAARLIRMRDISFLRNSWKNDSP